MKYSQVAFIAAVGSTLVSVSAHPLIEGAQKHISKTVTAAGGPEEVARKAGDIINLANQIHRRTVTDGGSSSSSTSTDATPGGGAAAVAETRPRRNHNKNKNHEHNRNHNHNQGAGSGEASRRRRRPHRLPQNTPGSTGSVSEGAASSNLKAQSTTSTPTSTSDSTASPASVRRSLNFGRQELSIRDLVDFDDELHARSPTEGDGNSGARGDANSTPGGAAAGPHHRHQGHHGGEGAEAEPHRQHHHSRPSEAGSLRRRIYDFGREDLVMRDLAELELGLHAREVVTAAGEQGESGSGNIPPAAAAAAAAGSTGETKPHRHRHHRPSQGTDAETQGSSQHPYHHHSHSEQPTTASSSASTTTTTSSDASPQAPPVRRDLVGSEGDEQLVARLFSNIRENYRQIKAARLAAKTAKWQAKAGGGGASGGAAPGGGSSNSGDSSNSRRGLFEDGLSELDARGFEDDSSLTERSVTDLAKAVWHNHKQNKALRLQRQSQLDAGKAASMNTGGSGSGGDGSSSQNGRRDFVDDDELEMRDFVDDESELVAREQAYAPHDPKLISREWFDELDTRGFEIEEMD